MKTKFYTVEDLMRMGKIKELGFGDTALSTCMEGQLTIYNSSIIRDKQMSINDILPKKTKKRILKTINLKNE